MTQTPERLPLSIADITSLRRGGFTYIDRTPSLRRLLQVAPFSLVLRPQGFGKSLMLSVLREIMEADHYAAVLTLDLGTVTSEEGLAELLHSHIDDPYATLDVDSADGLLRLAIDRLNRVSNLPVAILIDNYDTLAIRLGDNGKRLCRDLFTAMSSRRDRLRAICITGTYPPSLIGLEREYLPVTDVSQMPDLHSICGFSLDEVATHLPLATKKTDTARMSLFCGGYRFAIGGNELLNPSLVARYLSFDGEIPTGEGPALPFAACQAIIRYARSGKEITIPGSKLADTLFYSGFLTLSGQSKNSATTRYTIPNRTVSRSMFADVFESMDNAATSTFDIELMRSDLRRGDVDSFLTRVKALLATIPSLLSTNRLHEAHYHTLVHLLTSMLGFEVLSERAVSSGRIDMVVATDRYIYIFEFKIRENAATAMRQIEDKQYELSYGADPRTIIRVGVNFSDTTRTIESWQINS